MAYDEKQAIDHINRALSAEGRTTYPDDEILNVIDMIWDYYEENGLLDPDFDEDQEDEDIEQDLIDYVLRMLRKDRSSIVLAEDIPLIVASEISYEDSVL